MKQLFWIIPLFMILILTACQKEHNGSRTLKVAATSVPHAEILEKVKPLLEKEGIDLKIIVVDDYNTPNRALADREVDANFFQHAPFLEVQKKELGYPLKELAEIHIEPMGLYSRKHLSLKEIKNGVLIAIPNDPTNQARALLLLEKIKLIHLNRHDTLATLFNIDENPYLLKFIEIESPLLSRSLEDVDFAAITTNFALQAGLSPQKNALQLEGKDSPFANLLVIREGEENREELQALKKALQSETIRQFIQDKYKGAILPAF